MTNRTVSQCMHNAHCHLCVVRSLPSLEPEGASTVHFKGLINVFKLDRFASGPVLEIRANNIAKKEAIEGPFHSIFYRLWV